MYWKNTIPKFLFGKRLKSLYEMLDEKDKMIEYLEEQLNSNDNDGEMQTGDYCKSCKNSYRIGDSFTPIQCVVYKCRLNIKCPKFEASETM